MAHPLPKNLFKWAILIVMLSTKGFSHTYILDISNIETKSIEDYKNDKNTKWWLEASDKLLIKLHKEVPLKELPKNSKFISKKLDENRLFFVKYTNIKFLKSLKNKVIIKSGRKALIQSIKSNLINIEDSHHSHIKISKFIPNTIFSKLDRNYSFIKKETGNDKKLMIRNLLDELDDTRWKKYIDKLSTFNRHSLSAKPAIKTGFDQENNIVAAEKYLIEIFKSLKASSVEVQEFPLRTTVGRNVIATFTGTLKENKKTYIVGAHYDTTSEIPSLSAPGAEDNGTGTAALLELAHVITNHPPLHDIKFIAFSGEEQGLYGSKYFVNQLSSDAKEKIGGVLTMDMIGYSDDDLLDCLIETSGANKPLADELFDSAKKYTDLEMHVTFDYWGSDHVPFINAGIPTVLIIENDYDDYPDYHKSTDLPGNIHENQGIETLKMSLATMANWVY